MKNFKVLLIFIIVGFSANAQHQQQGIYVSDSHGIVLILNDNIIGSLDLLNSIPPDEIQDLNIYRDRPLSSKGNLFPASKDKTTIMVAKTDVDFEGKTQGELNEFFGLDPNSDLYVNGFLLEDKKYRISSKSISKVEVMEPDDVFLDERVLNITIK